MSTLNSLADRKREIRRQVRVRLEGALEPQIKSQMDQQIVARVDEILSQTSGRVGLFHPLAGEPDLMALAQAESQRRFAFPKMVESQLQFFSFKGAPRWKAGRFGVSEPDLEVASAESLDDLTVVCLPGVAFDRSGGRLGRGQGYYDRALKDFRGTKVGVAYAAQVVNESLPLERHDVTINYLVTEKYLLKVKG